MMSTSHDTARGGRRWKAALVLVALLSTAFVATGSTVGAEVPPGQTKVEGKIVGGTQAPAGAWPSQVGLLRSNVSDNYQAQFCGGTALNRNWVLTAAHCVEGEPTSSPPIDILAGTQSLTSGGTRHPVAEIRIINGFNGDTFARDIALIRVRKPFPPAVVSQVLIGQNVAVPGGTNAVATGWGSLSSGGSYPTQLMQVTVPMKTDAQCGAAYGSGYVASIMNCAGIAGKDSCQGDSGGPLVINSGGVYRQVGVTSFGEGCGLANYPGVYAKVSAFSSWIGLQSRYGPHPNNGSFADRVYRDLYNRAATSAERGTLTESVSVGSWTSGKILGTTNQARTAAVTRLYSAFFLRNPDTSGMSYWWTQVNAGRSLAWVANVMASSSEFQTRYGSLTNAEYIDLVYTNVLGRPADANGKAYWLGELNSGTKSRGQMMIGFSESSEYKNANSARVNVIITYFELLRRVPTTAEINADKNIANVTLVVKLLQSYAYALRFA